jgi:hypothetical protein
MRATTRFLKFHRWILAGGLRIVDGNGDGVEHVDMGALEYRNRAPIANAGDDRIVMAGSACLAAVSLNGSGSDADGDALTYAWTGPSGSTAGATLSLSLPIGSYVFSLNVDDHNGGVASDSVVITVVDAKAPEITAVAATPSMLLQTNHTMVPVAVTPPSPTATHPRRARSCRSRATSPTMDWATGTRQTIGGSPESGRLSFVPNAREEGRAGSTQSRSRAPMRRGILRHPH